MVWSSVQDFLAMGGYGGYVWGSCGVVFAALVAESWLLGRRLRQARLLAARRTARMDA
ncbi:heme exporter protein CcmD [Massilia sp. BJB1822]|uniref:heme exporter protein CcmD n=1 Tax=Massilia sp. BJB1822 TaxID=2744470 RepID=UPI001592FCAD|nr:heme exporter protein CcmD [Massilia sp. BJB1822]NVD97996.1 heme exporter protein CcmD [Massilia sp. BJB1822]